MKRRGLLPATSSRRVYTVVLSACPRLPGKWSFRRITNLIECLPQKLYRSSFYSFSLFHSLDFSNKAEIDREESILPLNRNYVNILCKWNFSWFSRIFRYLNVDYFVNCFRIDKIIIKIL